MGYRVAILPGILLRNAIATFDRVLGDLARTRMPTTITSGDNVSAGFQRFGADEWEAIRRKAASDPAAKA
jgi:hypothetical protein